MDEKIKEKTKFVDNIAYKSKFQFLIWVNDNVICQRYFKINGYNEDSVYTEEFNDCMNGIVDSIQKDLESKSRIFMWYTNTKEPMKSLGFVTDKDIERCGEGLVSIATDNSIVGKIDYDGKFSFTKEYINYPENTSFDYEDTERPNEGEFIFKFSFLIDDKPVFEKVWDGNVYPKFVRNGVDLTNNYAYYDNKETSSLSFGASIIRKMQMGKTNLITDFIRRICFTLSDSDEEKTVAHNEIVEYNNNNTIHNDTYENATSYYGVIKPVVTGHTDITPVNKKYNFLSAYENYKQSWRKSTRKKTYEYFETLYPSHRQIEFIDKHY